MSIGSAGNASPPFMRSWTYWVCSRTIRVYRRAIGYVAKRSIKPVNYWTRGDWILGPSPQRHGDTSKVTSNSKTFPAMKTLLPKSGSPIQVRVMLGPWIKWDGSMGVSEFSTLKQAPQWTIQLNCSCAPMNLYSDAIIRSYQYVGSTPYN